MNLVKTSPVDSITVSSSQEQRKKRIEAYVKEHAIEAKPLRMVTRPGRHKV